jgi:hypothetical protein
MDFVGMTQMLAERSITMVAMETNNIQKNFESRVAHDIQLMHKV